MISDAALGVRRQGEAATPLWIAPWRKAAPPVGCRRTPDGRCARGCALDICVLDICVTTCLNAKMKAM